MSDESGKLIAGHPVVAGYAKVERQLLGPVEGNQGGDGRDAPIARAQGRIGPHLAVQRIADEFGEPGVKSGPFPMAAVPAYSCVFLPVLSLVTRQVAEFLPVTYAPSLRRQRLHHGCMLLLA